jgi:hypothetical protein
VKRTKLIIESKATLANRLGMLEAENACAGCTRQNWQETVLFVDSDDL